MACVRTLLPALLHTPLLYLAHTLIGTWAPPLVYQLLAAGNWVLHLRCGRSARRQISTLSQLLVRGWTPTAEAELAGYLLYANETLIHPVPVWVLSVLVTLNHGGGWHPDTVVSRKAGLLLCRWKQNASPLTVNKKQIWLQKGGTLVWEEEPRRGCKTKVLEYCQTQSGEWLNGGPEVADQESSRILGG